MNTQNFYNEMNESALDSITGGCTPNCGRLLPWRFPIRPIPPKPPRPFPWWPFIRFLK